MAENTTISQFGKGIALNCGFDLGAQTLLDSRALVKDMEELEAMPQIRRANGLAVWVQDERRLMVWDGPNSLWVDVTASVDTSAVEKSLADLAERVSGNTESLETHTTEITEIRKTIEELNPECRFDDTADHKTTTAHGGLPAGTNIRGWKLADILDWILFPVIEPTIEIKVNSLVGDEYTKERLFKLGTNVFRQYNSEYSGFETYCGFEAYLTLNDFNISYPFDSLGVHAFFGWEITPYQNGIGKDGDEKGNCSSYKNTVNCDAHQHGAQLESFNFLSSTALLDYAKEVRVTFSFSFSKGVKCPARIEPLLSKTRKASVTLTFAKPIYVGVIGQNKTLSTDSDVAQYYNGTIENLDSGRTELIIADSVKTQKVNIPAFDNRQMCIVSPRKVTKILNPSSFDITRSFTLTTKNTGTLADADIEAGIPAGYADTDLYVYTSDLTSQAAAYPLTITFE